MSGILTKEKQKECMGVFLHFSKGKGEIDKYQLKAVLNALGADPDFEDLDKIWEEIDEDKSGYMDAKEFLELIARKMKDPFVEEDLISAFSNFDLLNTGYICIEDLKKIMCNYENIMTTEEYYKFISMYLNFEENEKYSNLNNSKNNPNGQHEKKSNINNNKKPYVEYTEKDDHINRRDVDYRKFAKFLLE